jgi:nicotinamidase-related amidase
VPRHPLTLLTREVRPLVLRPGATCLLLQDLHAPFGDAERGMLAREAARKVVSREFDEYFDTLRLVAPNFTRLLAAARGSGLCVAYSCLGYRAGAGPSAFQAATGWCWDLDGPDGAFPDGWRPRDGEPVFAKPGWGVLAEPACEQFLRERGIESVVIAGTMLEFGIRQTATELADRGIGSLVISDGVVPLTEAGQSQVAGSMAHGLAKLRSTAETLDLLDVMRRDGSVVI